MLIISYVRLFLHRIPDILNFATAIQEVHKPRYIVDCSVSVNIFRHGEAYTNNVACYKPYAG